MGNLLVGITTVNHLRQVDRLPSFLWQPTDAVQAGLNTDLYTDLWKTEQPGVVAAVAVAIESSEPMVSNRRQPLDRCLTRILAGVTTTHLNHQGPLNWEETKDRMRMRSLLVGLSRIADVIGSSME